MAVFSAKSDVRCKKRCPLGTLAYSITSSARATRVGGTVKPSAFGCFEIDDQFQGRQLLYRKFGECGAVQNPTDTNACGPECCWTVCAIANETAHVGVFLAIKNSSDFMLRR
jgi:hypothetical protein